MMRGRAREPGRTRECPHCKATILESAERCPACHHHLRFGVGAQPPERTGPSALRIEGTIANDSSADVWEYNLVVALYDERGAELTSKVIHVGALRPTNVRRCVVSFDVVTATDVTAGTTAAHTVAQQPVRRVVPAPARKPRGPRTVEPGPSS